MKTSLFLSTLIISIALISCPSGAEVEGGEKLTTHGAIISNRRAEPIVVQMNVNSVNRITIELPPGESFYIYALIDAPRTPELAPAFHFTYKILGEAGNYNSSMVEYAYYPDNRSPVISGSRTFNAPDAFRRTKFFSEFRVKELKSIELLPAN